MPLPRVRGCGGPCRSCECSQQQPAAVDTATATVPTSSSGGRLQPTAGAARWWRKAVGLLRHAGLRLLCKHQLLQLEWLLLLVLQGNKSPSAAMATAWQVVPEAQTAMVMVAGLTVTNNCGTVLLGPFFSPYRAIAWPIYVATCFAASFSIALPIYLALLCSQLFTCMANVCGLLLCKHCFCVMPCESEAWP